MPKFIHAADIHLDSPLNRLESYDGAPIKAIRGASRTALRNLTQLAIDQQVDFVLIAGDLYDGAWKDQSTGLFFAAESAKLRSAGIAIYTIRGNHDAKSVISKSLPLSDNPDGSSVMFDENCETRVLESLGVAIHGQSFGERAVKKNLANGYPEPCAGYYNIGMLHTSLTGTEGHDNYAPCSPTQLIDKGYDYWALGHIHTRGEHHGGHQSPIVFPGNIQGRHVRETGPKGCVLVEVDGTNRSSLYFHELDVVRWEVCVIDGSKCIDADEIVEQFASWAERYMGDYERGTLVVRIRVVGASRFHGQWLERREYYESALRSRSFDIALDRIWIEGLRVRTLAASVENDQHWDQADDAVAAIFGAMTSGELRDAGLESQLAALSAKLPNGLIDLRMDALLGEGLLEEARTSLLAKLRGGRAE